MSRPHEPYFSRNIIRLVLLIGALSLSSFAIAMPPPCDDEPCGPGGGGGGGYSYCGDGVCSGESCSSCPGDCGECPVNSGDGHIQCDGWDRQGACAFDPADFSVSAEFRRYRGGHDSSETYLSWGYNSSGLYLPDGDGGWISTSPLPGQVPLYHWSSNRGYVYDLNPYVSAHDYVYRGVAGYVWPPGTNQGYPLYRTFSSEYGFFYTSYPSELRCQRPVYWQPFVELARVNWPAPFAQAARTCYNLPPPPIPNCDPFAAARCRQGGGYFHFDSCSC